MYLGCEPILTYSGQSVSKERPEGARAARAGAEGDARVASSHLADEARPRTVGAGAEDVESAIGLCHRQDERQFALVAHEERVEPEDVAQALHRLVAQRNAAVEQLKAGAAKAGRKPSTAIPGRIFTRIQKITPLTKNSSPAWAVK